MDNRFKVASEWLNKFEQGQCDSSELMAMAQKEIREALLIADKLMQEPSVFVLMAGDIAMGVTPSSYTMDYLEKQRAFYAAMRDQLIKEATGEK